MDDKGITKRATVVIDKDGKVRLGQGARPSSATTTELLEAIKTGPEPRARAVYAAGAGHARAL